MKRSLATRRERPPRGRGYIGPLRARCGVRCPLFFFQAEDGIRARNVTGVQTCALPISPSIRSAIPDGHAVIEGTFSAEDAKLLSTVLKAGALQAPVRVIEERTVGASLG